MSATDRVTHMHASTTACTGWVAQSPGALCRAALDMSRGSPPISSSMHAHPATSTGFGSHTTSQTPSSGAPSSQQPRCVQPTSRHAPPRPQHASTGPSAAPRARHHSPRLAVPHSHAVTITETTVSAGLRPFSHPLCGRCEPLCSCAHPCIPLLASGLTTTASRVMYAIVGPPPLPLRHT